MKLNSVFYPLELLFKPRHTKHAWTAGTRFSCGSESVCMCVWNMSEMLPAVEQLSILKFVRTLSSHFKNAPRLINK